MILKVFSSLNDSMILSQQDSKKDYYMFYVHFITSCLNINSKRCRFAQNPLSGI